MLLYLTQYLAQFESGFNVFNYLTMRAIMGALTALAISFVIGPRMIIASLLERGVLCKDTHGNTIRLSPPLVVTPEQIDWAVEQIDGVLGRLA